MNSTLVPSKDLLTSDVLLKIYQAVKVEPKLKRKPFEYPPARKNYNIHLFG